MSFEDFFCFSKKKKQNRLIVGPLLTKQLLLGLNFENQQWKIKMERAAFSLPNE